MKKFLIILVVGIFVAALLAVGFGLFAAHAAQIEVAKNPEQAISFDFAHDSTDL